MFIPDFTIMSFLPDMKQKHSSAGSSSRNFQEQWTERYSKIMKGYIASCALCSETEVYRTSSVKRQYERNHKYLQEKSEAQIEHTS
jgi:hypothetical protein